MKTTHTNNFNTIASVYDALAKFVFGQEIRNSQIHFLSEIAKGDNVLILGGGTGWIVQKVLEVNRDCRIFYIEASLEMIKLSKGKIGNDDCVTFIHGDENSIPSHLHFDVVITNFYLDLFNEARLDQVINKIRGSLKTNSKWIITDFVNNGKWRHRFLLRLMYWFFKAAANIEASQLPFWEHAVAKAGFTILDCRQFSKQFIKSCLYRL